MRSKKLRMVFGLYGAGGFAREVMPIFKERISKIANEIGEQNVGLFFIETQPTKKEVNGYPLISEDDFFDLQCEERFFNIAIADSRARQRIAMQCIENGAKPVSLQSSNALVYDCNDIGEGAVICAYSTVTSNAKIGQYFHSNIYSYVAHDCVIGDYVTFAPKVCCNGNVRIEDHAYIGTGAIIRQGSSDKPLVIGEGAVVGMGAIVTKDVPPFTTVVGSPARPMLPAK